jgi:hypothetical protein
MSNNSNDNQKRGGKTAPSSDDSIEALRTPTIALGDIDDLHAYVRKIARLLARNEHEVEELTSHGMALALERFRTLGEGNSLSEALSFWLESRLRDYLRKEHREIRRNTRAGTTYTLPSPTGLAWEHSGTTAGMRTSDDERLIDSRLALQLFTGKEDLYDPRLIGRYLRVPSAARLATAAAAEIWAAIEEERALTAPKPFPFLKHDEFE